MSKEIKDIVTGVKRTIRLLNGQEKISLLIATLIMFFTGVLTNLPALFLGKLVDNISVSSNIHFYSALPFIFAIIGVILVREILNVVRKYLIENIATQTDKLQTVNLIGRLLKVDINGFLYKQQIGSLHGRIFRSMQGLIRMLKLTFLDFAPIFFNAVAAIIIALYQKPLIASVMILVIPTGLFLIIKQVSSQKGIRVSLLRGKEEIDGKVVEMLGGIETIRVLNTGSFETRKIEYIAERLRKIEIKHHIYMALFDAAKYLNEGFFYIVVIVLSIFMASEGIISRGDILVYSILFLSITAPLREVHRILDEAHESSIRVNDLYDLLNQPLDASFESAEPNKNLIENNIIVSTQNLRYGYKDGDELLHDINLSIKKGEKIGIAGVSGCGKTTFIHILLKLIHEYEGEFMLFGKDLSSISREEMAQKVAYVPQRPFIFSGTVKQNIEYGLARKISEDELHDATIKANIYKEIVSTMGGFEGRITENGNNLSGGQRQRIAIARVMLQSPELIIFDEATSALDNTNEAIIQENIEKQFSGKTMITIAHRLSTLKNSDIIFVFDKGTIAQQGTYNQLAEEQGLFQDFLRQRVV